MSHRSIPPCDHRSMTGPDSCRRSRWLYLAGLLVALQLPGLTAAQSTLDSAGAAARPHAEPASEAEGPEPGVVNINEASVEELTRLPGIGQRRAQAIIELRHQLEGFSKLPQIMRVRGIGRKTFRRLRPMLTLRGPTTLQR